MTHNVVAIDIGGSKIAAALVRDGVWSATETAPTPGSSGAAAILDSVAHLARTVGGEDIAAVGVGSAGSIDSERGVVIAATDTLAGWTGTNIRDELAQRLALPVARITVDNDVHAHARGEWIAGAGAGSRTMLMVAVGTGIGGAIVHDGKVFAGAHGAAGAIAHIPVAAASGLACTCGRSGHLEAVAAGPAISRAYAAVTGDPLADARRAVLDAGRGDERAIATLGFAGYALGTAIAGLVSTVDADRVVLGGGVAQADGAWLQAVEAGFADAATDADGGVPIVSAALGQSAALHGAADRALSALETQR